MTWTARGHAQLQGRPQVGLGAGVRSLEAGEPRQSQHPAVLLQHHRRIHRVEHFDVAGEADALQHHERLSRHRGERHAGPLVAGALQQAEEKSDARAVARLHGPAIHHDMTRHDAWRLRRLILKHVHYTNSKRGRDILDNWNDYLPRFVKVMPVDYRRALQEMQAAQTTTTQSATGGR